MRLYNIKKNSSGKEMKTVEQLSKIVMDLQKNVEGLMIRMICCQQYIFKLLKNIGESSSNQKFSSMDQINSTAMNQPDISPNKKRNKKSMPEVAYLNKNFQYSDQHKTVSAKQPSLKDFLLFPSSKETRNKQIESGSFSLVKNAILVNCHEIQKLQQSLQQVKGENLSKFQKLDQAIELLTKVTTMMQQKIQLIIQIRNPKSSKSSRNKVANQSTSKSQRFTTNYI